jgi:deoxyribose-phosphate aldolase
MVDNPSICEQTIEQVREELSNLLQHSAAAETRPLVNQAIAPEVVSTLSSARLAEFIDHTLLKPESSAEQVEKICREAVQFKCASACVNSSRIELCAQLLKGSGVLACSTIGFPLGSATPDAKASEAADAVEHGADELDMVINIGRLKDKDWSYVWDDVSAVIGASGGHTVKVILETGYLTEEEKIAACMLSVAAGASFVKTSTGFGRGGATVEDITLMRHVVGPHMGVKASGGVRDEETARTMLTAGANRIGASSTSAIVSGKSSTSRY